MVVLSRVIALQFIHADVKIVELKTCHASGYPWPPGCKCTFDESLPNGTYLAMRLRWKTSPSWIPMSFLFCIFAMPSYSRLARCDVQSRKVTAVSKCAKSLGCNALLDQFNKKAAKRIARNSVWAI